MKELSDQERGLLAMTQSSAGFHIITEMARDIVTDLQAEVIDATETKEIIRLQKEARAAAVVIGRLWKQINDEIELLNGKPKDGEPLPDITEGLMQ